MNLEELQAQNAAAWAKIQSGPKAAVFGQDPYYGFYTVDLFECPPFIMFTAHDCPRASDILYDRRFEPMSMKVWCRLVPLATSIFDIGAQVGVYSLAAASLRSDIPIQAFEPNPYAYTRLRIHKTVNGFMNIVENRFALADKEGMFQFSWVIKPGLPISSGGGLSPGRPGATETIIVEAKTFASLEASKRLGRRGLIKMDVEGAELLAFKGMGPGPLEERPDIILESFSAQACEAIQGMIEPLGYRSYLIQENEGNLVRQQRLQARAVQSGNFNQLLTTRPEAELISLLS
jgi:FkbM family methyltransferase